jgi:hypothetical protein
MVTAVPTDRSEATKVASNDELLLGIIIIIIILPVGVCCCVVRVVGFPVWVARVAQVTSASRKFWPILCGFGGTSQRIQLELSID